MNINNLEGWQKIFLGALFKKIKKEWSGAKFKGEMGPNHVQVLDSFFKNPIFEQGETEMGSAISTLVQEAECLSVGSTQTMTGEGLTSLRCVFDSISLYKNSTHKQLCYQHISKMTPFNEYIFPQVAIESDLEKKYSEKWKYFYQELAEELGENLNIDLTSLYSSCKKHLWCIPSSSELDQQDISLFEQSRLAAAIAVCMYHTIKGENPDVDLDDWQPSLIRDRYEERYLLVCADFSGIQSFIYNIAHSGALKALKGRSFLLQQILDHTAIDLIRCINLTDANILYSSGGKFYILAPNTKDTLDSIRKVGRSTNETLLNLYGSESSLLITQLSLKGEDFLCEANNIGELSKKWGKLNEMLASKSRFRKFEDIMGEDFFVVPENIRSFGAVEFCYATGIELCTKKALELVNEERTEDDRFLKVSVQHKNIYKINDRPGNIESPYLSEEQFIVQQIGRKLRSSQSIGTYFSRSGNRGLFHIIGDYGITLDEVKPKKADRNTLLNNDDIAAQLGSSPAKSFKFYGGNWQLDEGLLYGADNKKLESSFEYWKENASGISHLAVLRMDVDNLGKIFKDGLGERATISRIVQLSAMLDYFFCGYLNKMKDLYWSPENGITEKYSDVNLENALQIVYSGGDDLFVVGRWDVIPDVALWIRKEFKRYVGNHPELSISAGIALFNAQQPLFKVAELAGEAEKSAKNYSWGTEEKNKDAICFLGNPMCWDDFQKVSNLAKTWFGYINGDSDGHKLPRAFLGLIQSVFAEFVNTMFQTKKFTNLQSIILLNKDSLSLARFGPWRWRAAYSMKRMGERHKVFEQKLHQIALDLFLNNTSEKEYLFLMNTAAQWADYLTRKK